ncbi:MAG: 4-hydroxy-tetrahydrodipicolinate reductase [Alphaproteobacteria bacterium]|nr:4-hydroxy-tetrahydrodipicolinate reductase [Alphaproteobacteria bacterium]
MKIGVAGCTGRVGVLIVQELLSGQWKMLELAGGTARNADKIKVPYFVTTDPAALFARADIVIDFSRPEATLKNAALAAETGKALIVGTTGLSAQDEAALAQAAKKTAIVYAANMSVGVNLLLALVEQAAARLGPDDWDIEIFETHHKHKIDAPSGTALAIGKAAAKGRRVKLEDEALYAREGVTGERIDGNIGFSVARGGDVVGEHTAFFYGAGERLEISHRATNRALFAKGALRAALWLAKNRQPGLSSMRDVLGL